MKSLMISMLVATQILVAAQPTFAADLGDEGGAARQRHGAFAGARLRVPLGGGSDTKARAALAVAPVLESRDSGGSLRTRFGEGVELGFADREKVGLSLGGTRLSDLGQGPNGRKLGVSSLGWVAIGLGAALVIGTAAFVAAMEHCPEHADEC